MIIGQIERRGISHVPLTWCNYHLSSNSPFWWWLHGGNNNPYETIWNGVEVMKCTSIWAIDNITTLFDQVWIARSTFNVWFKLFELSVLAWYRRRHNTNSSTWQYNIISKRYRSACKHNKWVTISIQLNSNHLPFSRLFVQQKSLQVGREYTNIRYSTEGGLTPATTSPQSQPLLDSPTGKGLSKSTLSLANPLTPLPSLNLATATMPKDKSAKETKNLTSRTVTEHQLPMCVTFLSSRIIYGTPANVLSFPIDPGHRKNFRKCCMKTFHSKNGK